MDLVLFGIQGSGKGTQAKRLADECGYDIFEAGGELRKIAASGSVLGKAVKSFIDAGNLVPHEIIMAVVKSAISARPKETKIIFDGIPRDEAQMRDFDAIMQDADRKFLCIEIMLSEEAAKKRILERSKREQRVDDGDIAIIEKRMNTFLEKTRPIIDAYKTAGKLIEIDGGTAVEEVYVALKEAIALNA